MVGQVTKLILFIIVLVMAWYLYNSFLNDKLGNIMGEKIISIPNDVKCFFKESNCEEGDIDGWTLLSGFIYLIAGYLIPNNYFAAIIISIAIEIAKFKAKMNSKFIVNPLFNITGYAIGSYLYEWNNKKSLKEKYKVFEH
jgi:energy-coupling factor transporter transmembrane protein EcfT